MDAHSIASHCRSDGGALLHHYHIMTNNYCRSTKLAFAVTILDVLWLVSETSSATTDKEVMQSLPLLE